MMNTLKLIVGIALACGSWSQATEAKIPQLPKGGQTHWRIENAEEIVAYATFDPRQVEHQLPPNFRFLKVGELAEKGTSWARVYLSEHPQHEDWGFSFIEIVRMDRFAIDGISPNWAPNGAAALWFARITSFEPNREQNSERTYLMLNFWVPDRDYVRYMKEKGYYSTYGDASLYMKADGSWHGRLDTDNVKIEAVCYPVGRIRGGPQSTETQVLVPPKSSKSTDIIHIAFAGHRIQDCTEESTWIIEGEHPLSDTVIVEPSTLQYGYNLNGSVYTVQW
ncbi:hypothetical protein [Pelagicoccus sp. SDUM812002]|uniref:hypothetical protein n=1 Tax=Pelagicoccus sp. SDUM812002 TaxID=3041266 RepID=UPI00280C743F|nr:hypothetical protein [Pelagicoccus sp. SDUM812002]MDQ8188604.1 hypothetical protein [Pelagicoccus sp. SDUM812002]